VACRQRDTCCRSQNPEVRRAIDKKTVARRLTKVRHLHVKLHVCLVKRHALKTYAGV
jgi:hypothetical protein